MASLGYRDYLGHLFDDSPRVRRISEQVLANSGEYLDGFSGFIKQRFIENSGIVMNLTYAKVEAVQETLQSAVFEGFRLYACVANLNQRTISRRPNLNLAEIYTSFSDNEQHRERLLDRYDVLPVINRYEEIIFNGFLDNNPDFLNYPFKETNLVRITTYVAVQNAYLLCLSSCE
ncbi:MAG: hypothetical protein H6646_02445 [Anaerolineales bacterium]|nr:hypothetical protein [Anaerolineales bacterium]MCB9141115.1 hypothetical protein [Anaerolineales bacterium]